MVQAKQYLNIGFFVNPYAGAGGPAGLKGSDSETTKKAVVDGDIAARAPQRAAQFLQALNVHSPCKFLTVHGSMGADIFVETAKTRDLEFQCLDYIAPEVSSAQDSKHIATQLLEAGVDLIVFVGGDGTARDVCSAVGERIPVLGVPSGVKMHSGVFAITPLAAAKIMADLLSGKLLSLLEAEVRDIDEAEFQQGRVKSRYYGSMLVPDELRYIQNVKQGGIEVDELVLMDIAADIRERLDDEENQDALVILATGSTTQFIQTELGCPGTLLGVDVYHKGTLLAEDVSAIKLEKMLEAHEGKVIAIVTAIGGQGHILGRGNQQLSPKVLRRIGRDNLWVVATKAKLNTLDGKPLIMDSNDPLLDQQWQGLIGITTGYQDQVLYRLGILDD